MNVEIIKLTQGLSRTQAAAMVPHRPAAPGAERRPSSGLARQRRHS